MMLNTVGVNAAGVATRWHRMHEIQIMRSPTN